MTFGSSNEDGCAADASPGRADQVAGDRTRPAAARLIDGAAAAAAAVGIVQSAVGLATIRRANGAPSLAVAGDAVRVGDAIETGGDGAAVLAFVDGTTFHLGADSHLVIDEFRCRAGQPTDAALFRVAKGVFGFVAGKVAAAGRLVVDTPVGQIRNAAPAAGVGGFAFSLLTIGLVHELKAASADIVLIDDGSINYKDLKHGVFEILTKEDNPRLIVVDDPGVTIILHPKGSGSVSIDSVANSPADMQKLHNAYQNAFDTYSQGQQDPYLQQLLRGLNPDDHANAQPQSAPGTTGSSTPPGVLGGQPLLQPVNFNSNGSNGPGSGSGGPTGPSGPPPGLPGILPQDTGGPQSTSNVFIWISPNSGTFEVGPNWDPGMVPTSIDKVEINLPPGDPGPLFVFVTQSESIGGLELGPGVILEIEPGGSLTIAGNTENAGTILLDDPVVTYSGAAALTGGGTIEMIGPTAGNVLTGTPGTTLTNVDNTIVGSGLIGQGDSHLTFINHGTVDATPEQAGDSGQIIIHTGNTVTNTGVLEATQSSFGAGTLQIEDNVANTGTVAATAFGTVIIDGIEITNTGGLVEAVGTNAAVALESATIVGGTLASSGGGMIESQSGTSVLENVTMVGGTAVQTSVGTTINLEGTTSLDGTVTFTGGGTFALQGSIGSPSGVSAELDNFGTIIGGGAIGGALFTLVNESGATIDANNSTGLTINAASFTNNGELEANGATLNVQSAIAGSGSATITGDGTFVIGSTDTEGTTFNGAGTFAIEHAGDFTGTLQGFSFGDGIDLTDVTDSSGVRAVWTQVSILDGGSGTLAIFNGTTLIETIDLSGIYDPTNFLVTSDPSGKAEVVFTAATEDSWINTAGGNWNDAANWSAGVPNASTTAVIDIAGAYTVTISGDQAAGSLTIGNADATVSGSGTLTVGTLDNDGRIKADAAGDVLALGVTDTFTNAGHLKASHGGELTITDNTLDNSGVIKSAGEGSELTILNDDVDGRSTNDGTMAAVHGGMLTVTNEGDAVNDGVIKSVGEGSELTLNDNVDDLNKGLIKAADHGRLTINIANPDSDPGPGGNSGRMEAVSGGTLSIVGDFANLDHGTVKAEGRHSLVEFLSADYPTGISNDGRIIATHHGTVLFDDVALDNSATILAKDGGTIIERDVLVTNEARGVTEAIDGGKIVADLENGSWNYGRYEAADGGTLILNVTDGTGNSGTLTAVDGGTVILHLDGQGDCDLGSEDGRDFKGGNFGTISAADGGSVHIFGDLLNGNGAENGGRAPDGSPLGNGKVEAFAHGTITIAGDTTNERGATMGADGFGAKLLFFGGELDNSGDVHATRGGLVLLKDAFIANDYGATIGAGACGLVVIDHSLAVNDGVLGARDGGTFDIAHSTITQDCTGVVVADGFGSTVDLYDASIVGGTLVTYCDGVIQTVAGPDYAFATSTFDDVTIACGSDVVVNNGTSLVLENTIDNKGAITVGTTPGDPDLVIDDRVTLDGGGNVILSGAGDNIVGDVHSHDNVLINADNTISGAGMIGGDLSLYNGFTGVIDADERGRTLTVDTSHDISNAGTLEANGGRLLVDNGVLGWGSGSISDGGVLDFQSFVSSGQTINFADGHGTLALADPAEFYAKITGLKIGDTIDLTDIAPCKIESATVKDLYHQDVLIVDLTDGQKLTFDIAGNLTNDHFAVKSDGGSGTDLVLTANGHDWDGGNGEAFDAGTNGDGIFTFGSAGDRLATIAPAPGTPVLDQVTNVDGTFTEVALASDQTNLAPGQVVTQSHANVSVSVGGPGNDNFVFAPGVGADTIVNFNPQNDTIELDHFSNAHNLQQLASLITTDAHGNALIELGHNDSIDIPGVSASYLQAHLQSLVHLH
jgi:hypothetical protein